MSKRHGYKNKNSELEMTIKNKKDEAGEFYRLRKKIIGRNYCWYFDLITWTNHKIKSKERKCHAMLHERIDSKQCWLMLINLTDNAVKKIDNESTIQYSIV